MDQVIITQDSGTRLVSGSEAWTLGLTPCPPLPQVHGLISGYIGHQGPSVTTGSVTDGAGLPRAITTQLLSIRINRTQVLTLGTSHLDDRHRTRYHLLFVLCETTDLAGGIRPVSTHRVLNPGCVWMSSETPPCLSSAPAPQSTQTCDLVGARPEGQEHFLS